MGKTIIGDYEMMTPLTTDNSGFSRWGIAEKDNTRVFIKEFLTPSYPSSDSGLSEKQLQSKKEICENFFSRKRALYQKLKECHSGNIVWVEDFFRYGARYYITTEYVEREADTVCAVQGLPDEKKMVITKILMYNLALLHKAGIVHSDIKPSNVLIKSTCAGYYTAKLIDYDASFLIDSPPKTSEDVHGDFVYLAPEVFIRMRDEKGELNDRLDVFSLGILLHELWCGSIPQFSSEFNYPFEAVINGYPLVLDNSIPSDVLEIISTMLVMNPEDRPSSEECFSKLCGAYTSIVQDNPLNPPYQTDENDEQASTPLKDGNPWYHARDLNMKHQ